MFENYIASIEDLNTINEALGFIIHPKMKFVFADFLRISKTLIVSYDSRFIYIWQINPIKLTHKIPHSLTIPDKWQQGWWAGLVSEKIEEYLPEEIKQATRFEIPVISGGLLTPFIELQKKKDLPNNPYITKESYLSTTAHEFGHIYFGGHGKKGELSAFCTEYYASDLFWSKHKTLFDKFYSKFTDKNNPHIFGMIYGKKLMSDFPETWPEKLLNNDYLG